MTRDAFISKLDKWIYEFREGTVRLYDARVDLRDRSADPHTTKRAKAIQRVKARPDLRLAGSTPRRN